jgi:hypothetical protein
LRKASASRSTEHDGGQAPHSQGVRRIKVADQNSAGR